MTDDIEKKQQAAGEAPPASAAGQAEGMDSFMITKRRQKNKALFLSKETARCKIKPL